MEDLLAKVKEKISYILVANDLNDPKSVLGLFEKDIYT
jgi:hypothetical protein